MGDPKQSWQREEEELRTVLGSDLFARAPSLAMLLEYICRKRFDGEDHLIKEYNIAVEALGRPPDFDQKKDSIVRVEAHRLRKRLKQYYQREGAAHEIEIEILPRGYMPVFKSRSEMALSNGPAANPANESLDEEQMWDDLGFGSQSDPVQPLAAIEPAPAPKPMPWPRVAIGLAVIATLALAVGLAKWRRPTPDEAGKAADSSNAASVSGAPRAEDSLSEVRISCGSSRELFDREGHLWMADRYFSGGEARVVNTGEFEGTLNPELFRSWREGTFTYRIPLKLGVYELALSMAEPAPTAGQPAPSEGTRLFDVVLNGRVVLSEFDLFSDAGATGVANWKVFRDVRPDESGNLVIEMRSRVGGAVLNGISVSPGIAGRLRPIRVGMRERPYTDVAGRLWAEDRFFTGGRQVKRIEDVSGTEDSEIYRCERYGRLKYTIPAPADSTYTLILHFAETWFGGTGKGGVGSRLFDVLCNGQILLSSFDVYREAGGPFRALTKVFRGIKPRENDKIVLEMIPARNYAFLNAFEVIDERPGDARVQPKQTAKQ